MPYIILDRDGVINHNSTEYIRTPDEWIPIAGSLEAIAQLNRAGYRVLVATNQSGIARGYYDIATLDAMHEKMMQALAAVGGYIEEIFFCPHHPDEGCRCRKPNLGMIEQMQSKYPLDVSNTYFIGDSEADLRTAIAAGCQPLLVLTGNGARVRERCADLQHVPCFDNLAQAVEFVIGR